MTKNGADNKEKATSKESVKPRDILDRSFIWFALGMLVAGGIGTIAFLKFVSGQVRGELQKPENITLIANSIPTPNPYPDGAHILFDKKCPEEWQDLTSALNGRYIFIDKTTIDEYELHDSNGDHVHKKGEHAHDVTGKTGPLGGGERRGNEAQNAAHKSNVVKVTGTAHSEKSGHSHTEGQHEHMRVGFRICKPSYRLSSP